MIAIDTNVLIAWSSPGIDSLVRAAVEEMFRTIVKERSKIIIPAPVMAEYLVKSGSATEAYLARIERSRSVVVAPFDRKAAYECALIERQARAAGDKRHGVTAPYQTVKVDRQIVAIARVANARTLVSDDEDLRRVAQSTGLAVMSLKELPVPEEARQMVIESVDPPRRIGQRVHQLRSP